MFCSKDELYVCVCVRVLVCVCVQLQQLQFPPPLFCGALPPDWPGIGQLQPAHPPTLHQHPEPHPPQVHRPIKCCLALHQEGVPRLVLVCACIYMCVRV